MERFKPLIVMPALNEEKTLNSILLQLVKICSVLVVDDGSTDSTASIVSSSGASLLQHKTNKGLSITMETGFKIISNNAKANDVIITLDSDNTHPISIIPNMIKKIDAGNHMVIASRFVKTSKINGLTIWRHLLSVGAKYLFKLLYPYKNLNDYTCNFRAYRFELIKELLKNKKFFKNEDFNIAAKILLFLTDKYKNIKLIEVPFTLSYDYKIGQSKMRLMKTILLTLRLIFFKSHK